MKIAIYTVCKNERKNIDEWFMTTPAADYVIPVDTGSIDGTWERIQEVAALNHQRSTKVIAAQISVCPWRFDVARNAALSLVPADADVCLVLDLDERLSSDWREQIENNWVLGETTQGFFRYIFERRPDGEVALEFMQNRIHSRHGWLWRFPAHEGLYPYGGTQPLAVSLPHLVVEQRQDKTVDRMSRDLNILRMAYEETPDSPRMTLYYARQLGYCGRYDEAIPLIRKYLAMPKPEHPWEEKHAAETLAWCLAGKHGV